MASSKGKGILLEEDDDEPIQLPDQADEHLIREYNLSLINKILNLKKNVERLIVAMLEQWGISEKITAYDLGNDTAGRYQNASKERVWKEKQLRPLKINHQTRDTSSGSTGEGTKPRSNSSTRTLVSYVEATTEDLIPPYNALNAAMNECDNDNEEGDAADADMEEPIGNELMIMEEMT
ncbi:hypothetical protein HID58_018250 [Brassica napus]|uniref:Uncharacterized protein n=1 Tax=Brassica napus TaxID=3708 RepID=A0ABQ8D9D3_BRANA|nr:hypothetical protein HID58_018250 [Brassica napus]